MTYPADDLAPPYRPPAGYEPVALEPYRLPTGLKVLAVIVSVAKALPIIVLFIGLVVVGAIFGAESDGNDIGEVFAAIFAVLAIVVGIVAVLASILLIGQIVAALRNRRTGLSVFAGILSAIDLVLVVGAIASWSDARGGSGGDAASGLAVLAAMAMAQISVLVWALRSETPPHER